MRRRFGDRHRLVGSICRMLHGRESLKRLIGKRRRSPSPHVAQLLLLSQQESSQVPKRYDGGGGGGSSNVDIITGQKEAPDAGDGPAGSLENGWVSCPVCGGTVRGDDYSVNSHLDSCLLRGTKRKLNQCTLLQFQFSRRSTNKLDLDDLGDDRQDGESMISMVGKEPGHSFATPVCDLKSVVCDHSTSDTSETVPSISQFCAESTSQILTIRDGVDTKMVEPQLSSKCPQGTTVLELEEPRLKDAYSVVTFETCIVGRRFHEDAEWQPGVSISLVRDHKNAKDTHAIKVLYAESGCLKVVGYLPRELSKYISPLMDKHIIECEGIVNSVPKRSSDTVPIQLICRKAVTFDEIETVDVQNSEYLWEALLQTIKSVNPKFPSILRCQKNFILMIEDVMKNYNHLFTTQEQSFIGSLKTLSCEGQMLFIRLYMRKGPWFRVSNISYPEIQDPHEAIEELQLAGYVYLFDSGKVPFRYDMKEVLSLLNVSELREILPLVSKNGVNCTRRDDLINTLFSAYKNGRCQLLPNTILQRTGTCARISLDADTLFSRVQRLFFLNGEQDLAAFLLVDLGIIKFPEYICNVSNQIFPDRSVLIAYEEAIEVAQIMDESLDDNNDDMMTRCIGLADSYLSNSFGKDMECRLNGSSPAFFSRFSASWVYSKVICLGVSFYEREHRYKDAIRLLKGLLERIPHDSRRGYLTLRLSVDLEHTGHINESLLVAEKGVLDPWVRAGSRVALQRRALRLGKPPRRWKKPDYAYFVNRKIKEVVISGRPLTCETGIKNSYYGYDGELCGVEQLALQYYADEGGGWQGVHSESGIWRTIFGLIMWDVIFSNVPDVFFSRFQIAPLDLHTDDFYEARKSLIESQLEKVRNGMAEEILIMSWESHFGTACLGINWEKHSLSDLRAAASCIGGHCLSSLCRHLSLDYESWSSGMPDLLLWRFHGDDNQGEAKVVEVKGPRDRLSEQQRAWMLILMDIGFDTEVCKVSPISKAS